MRGLTAREAYLLRLHAAEDVAITDEEEEDTLPLVSRGLVRHWTTVDVEPVTAADLALIPPGADPDDYEVDVETDWYETTEMGRLALRVCTVTP